MLVIVCGFLFLIGSAVAGSRLTVPKTPARPGETVQIDGKAAPFYWTSCTANPKSVMGRIPANTRVRVEETTGCDTVIGPGRRVGRLAYTLMYYKVKFNGESVWISSGVVGS